MELGDIARRLVRERPGMAFDDIADEVARAAGVDPDDPEAMDPIDRLLDDHLEDGRWEILAGDRIVDPVALSAAVVLTHRLTENEIAIGLLDLKGDLSGFRFHPQGLRTTTSGEITNVTEFPVEAWWGPDDWFASFDPGALVSVRVDDGVVVVEAVAEPATDDALVALVRAVYEAEVDEPQTPVDLSDLVFGAVLADAEAFARPRPPLGDLCTAAALEVRGSLVAHDEEIWDNQRHLWRLHAVMDVIDGSEARLAVLRMIDVVEGKPWGGEEVDAEAAVHALPERELSLVASILLDGGALATPLPLDALADRLTAVLGARAWRPRDEAKLRWLAAVFAERRRHVADARGHLEAAVRLHPRFVQAVDRLAWYRSDAGDADGARALWGTVTQGGFHPDLAVLSALPRPGGGSSGRLPGRNEPCWCGSGRKFKVCHLGRQETVPLPDRVLWLNRKAIGFVERRGGLDGDLRELAECRAGVDREDDPDAVEEAFDDPLVVDVALVEGGWFDVFVAERGELLPDDEALLAASWSLIERTVYEVVAVTAGASITARDLRTGDELEVRERNLSGHVNPRTLLCGRAVPDGEGHQFVGAIFAVPPGREGRLLEILDERDGHELLEYVSALERPPSFGTAEGDPLVDCRAELVVDDPAAAAAVLDEWFEPGDDGGVWHDVVDLDDEVLERRVRAVLRLDGDRLAVEAMSERRLEGVLADVLDALPEARVVADERVPIDVATMAQRMTAPGWAPAPEPDSPELRAALEQIADRFERRWCDEPVPALGGLTPRAAVADPTRREEVERLLASFPEPEPDELSPSGFAMRPARLRELLGLPPA